MVMTSSKILKKIADEHKNWVKIVKSFGCNTETAEDIVQEMYIKIKKKLEKNI